MDRADLLDRIAAAILAVERPHPTRVAVDGHSAAGKSTLVEELAPLIEAAGRPCVCASIDDFHPPGHAGRSASGRYSPEGYYDEAYEYERFREFVLDPMGPTGAPGRSRRCRLKSWDSFQDRAYPEEWVDVPANAVAIIEASFAFRPELASAWDFAIWLDIDFETMIDRAAKRDVAWVGSEDAVVERYRTRNVPLHQRYVELTNAPDRADVVIDNNDVWNPVVLSFRALRHGSGQAPRGI